VPHQRAAFAVSVQIASTLTTYSDNASRIS
jgi:hypothetical protein